jgi:Fe-S-cluster containining protein
MAQWCRMPDTRNPCTQHACDICCRDTRMSLTEADVRRLEHAGHRGFFRCHDDGTLRLVNVDGCCIFLDAGRCSAYPERPDGCVLYPLIWYEEDGTTGLHDVCPYRFAFRFSQGDREWLARSIAVEETEVAARLLEPGG